MNDPAMFPAQSDVDALRELLDLLGNFSDNDQRARYVLSSNWLRDNGARLAAENAAMLARVQQRLAR